MKLAIIISIVLSSCHLTYGQDHYSGKFSTGSNSSGWYKIATIDVTPGGCCNSVNINARIHYVNTSRGYFTEAVMRHRAGKVSSDDRADWFYTTSGISGEVLQYRNVGLFQYELWGNALGSYSHFYIEITVTKESTTLVTINTTAVPAVENGQGVVDHLGDIFYPSQKLVIGQTQPVGDYKLAIDGKALAEEIVVKESGSWPDYVFDEQYKLKSLSELEAYITEYRHLPEIPSAEEVSRQGQSLGEMNKLLLKKLEEITLYTIQQEKRLNAQDSLFQVLFNKIENNDKK